MTPLDRDALFERELTHACAQLRCAREREARPPKRKLRPWMIAAAVLLLLTLLAAGTGAFYLPDHAGTMQLEAVYNEDGTRACSPDGYPIWIVTESDDPDMAPGTYLIVDPATKEYAVYAPPEEQAENTASVALPAEGAHHAPVSEYISWALLTNGTLCIYAEAGTPLYAIEAGTVAETGYQGPDGYCITVVCADGAAYRYAHCASFAVSPGDAVTAGQTIAFVGVTGQADRPLCVITAPDEWEIDSFFGEP